MAAKSYAAQRIFGEYESVTTASFIVSMIAFKRSPSCEFAIGGKSMTNLDCNGPAKSWTWSGGPVQTRSFDLDGRQTGYPYTATGTVNGPRPPRLGYDLGNRIKNLTGAVSKTYGYDGPRPPCKLDRLTSYSKTGAGSRVRGQVFQSSICSPKKQA